MNPSASPTPTPTPTGASTPLTTLDYAAHVSGNSDIALVVIICAAVLILISLGILVSRGIA